MPRHLGGTATVGAIGRRLPGISSPRRHKMAAKKRQVVAIQGFRQSHSMRGTLERSKKAQRKARDLFQHLFLSRLNPDCLAGPRAKWDTTSAAPCKNRRVRRPNWPLEATERCLLVEWKTSRLIIARNPSNASVILPTTILLSMRKLWKHFCRGSRRLFGFWTRASKNWQRVSILRQATSSSCLSISMFLGRHVGEHLSG